MELCSNAFNERIQISGMNQPVLFIFRMLHGDYCMKYKVRSTNPEADFEMENGMDFANTKFKFCDHSEVPGWLLGDDAAQRKLSNAIKTANSK